MVSDSTGETLKARMERRPLRLIEALDLAEQIATELAASHERGIVHGALEPATVMIYPVQQVQVVGFGPASPAVGATAYRSPEQFRGATGDARSDIWALGVILYEMLAGRVPFAGTAEEVARAILEDAPPPLAVPEVPRTVSRIVERALAKDPAERYGRMEQMRADLQAVEMDLMEEPTQHKGGGGGLPGAVPFVLTGRRVSHFQVTEFLGGGGMGVVYRAEDTRLGRTLALKFLAPELGRDPTAKARFLTEARAASALEHSNLCTILDIGETEDGLLFLAMPLYEGESLERRLARGPVPVQEALDIATQAARGLAKAHQHGIVHRDIKPANLFLTDEGTVKVLDFGIAKLLGKSGPTEAGSLLGTPFYMAPEQMRGEEVDARADVWALGAVLYQMLAGRPPFPGGTGAAVVHAVLYEELVPLTHLRLEVPPEIERVVTRMLAKDQEQRYADAGAALADLRRAQGLASVTISNAPTGRTLWRVGLTALGCALVTSAGFVGLMTLRKGAASGPQPTSFTRLTDYQGKETFPSFSPDGTFFAYAKSVAGNSDIFLQRVAGGKPINLTADSPANDTQPAFSPDGQQIAFRSEREGGGIFLMGATGESVRRLTDFGFNPAWSPDGREIAVATEGASDPAERLSLSKIVLIDVMTAARRKLDIPDGLQPSWSPHGWRIAFWGLVQPGAHRAIWTIPINVGRPVTVVDDTYYNWSPVWSPDGKFLYFASNRGGSMNLWRVAVDERSGKVLGSPHPITTPSEWCALPSFSRDGRQLLYATNDNRSFVERVAFDPAKGNAIGPPSLVFQGARSVYTCDVSPDEKTWALWTDSPQDDLLLVGPSGSNLRLLTNDPSRDRAPRWSPDGRRLLFYSNRSGKYEAWTIRPDGSGMTQITHLPAHDVYNPAWSPDGKRIGFTYGPQGAAILDLANPTSRLRVLPPVEAGQVLARLSWSMDGRFLAGQLLRQDESPIPGVVLWSLADNTYRRLTRTGADPVFFHSGTRILFTERDAIRLVEVVNGEVRTLLTPLPNSSYVSTSVGPSDLSLCTVRTTDEGDIWMLSLVDSTDRP
jgi:eukaryotic-like serine/threonine-protein kinase